ncbi:MAG: FAD-binding oxidoreductase, partial [Anaerolineales bacterium]
DLMGALEFTEAPAAPVKLHAHCHAKALTGSMALHKMLNGAGYSVEEIDSGCCGMAGSFGYEYEHYALSMQVGELKVLPAARSAEAAGEIVAAHGVSCRTQISDGTDVSPRHPIELVAERLTE